MNQIEEIFEDVCTFAETLDVNKQSVVEIVCNRIKNQVLVVNINTELPDFITNHNYDSLTYDNNHNDLATIIATDKIVLLLEGGKLLEPQLIRYMEEIISTRPSDSFIIVYILRETIITQEDLDVLERSARRLFLDQKLATSPDVILSDRHIFVWAKNSPEWLSNRLDADLLKINKWLGADLSPDVIYLLQYKRCEYLLNTIEDTFSKTERIPSKDTQEVANLMIGIQRLQTQIENRIAGEIESLKVHIQGSVSRLQRDLQNDIIRHENKPINQQTRQSLEHSLQQNYSDWLQNEESVLNNRISSILSGLMILLDEVDWKIVNEILAQHNEVNHYPETLIDKQNITFDDFSKKRSPQTFQQASSFQNMTTSIEEAATRIVGASALGLFVGVFLPFPTILAGIASGGGMTAIEMLRFGQQSSQVVDQMYTRLQQAMISLESSLLSELNQLKSQFNLKESFEHLTQVLTEINQESASFNQTSDTEDDIQNLRERLLNIQL